MRIISYAMVALFGLLGCERSPVSSVIKNSQSGSRSIPEWIEAHKNALPLLRQFNEAFPTTTHMLLSSPPDSAIWSANALIHGKYVLNLRVPLRADKNGEMIQAPGEIQFHIVEIQSVSGRKIKYAPNQMFFGLEEWNRLIKANMDFSVIGYEMVRDKPVDGLEAVYYGA